MSISDTPGCPGKPRQSQSSLTRKETGVAFSRGASLRTCANDMPTLKGRSRPDRAAMPALIVGEITAALKR
jgi:hypothetical protein